MLQRELHTIQQGFALNKEWAATAGHQAGGGEVKAKRDKGKNKKGKKGKKKR